MAEKKKRRIPKKVGGMKISKDLRRTGEALIDTVVERANSPQGHEMIAGALTMMAAAATAAVAKGRAAREPRSDRAAPPTTPVPPAPPNGATHEPDFQAIAETIGNSAEMMLGRLFGGKKA